MNFWQAVASGFSNCVKFSGRAIRSEYWYWVLFVSVVSVATVLFDVAIVKHRHGPLEGVWHLVTFLPGLPVAIRRLHDIDRSGWWIALLPIFAGICFAMLLVSALRSIALLIIRARLARTYTAPTRSVARDTSAGAQQSDRLWS